MAGGKRFKNSMPTLSEPFAVIDIGSNSMMLTIAVELDGRIYKVRRENSQVRSGNWTDGKIDHKLENSVIKELTKFVQICRAHPVQHKNIRIYASGGIREAKNCETILEQIQTHLPNVKIMIVSSEHEALMSWVGACEGADRDPDEPGILIDLGGRTTEIAVNGTQGIVVHPIELGHQTINNKNPEATSLTLLTNSLIEQLPNDLIFDSSLPVLMTGGIANDVNSRGISLTVYSTNLRDFTRQEINGSEEDGQYKRFFGGLALLLAIVKKYELSIPEVTTEGFRTGLITTAGTHLRSSLTQQSVATRSF